jgi:hypothetical protein
MKFYNSFQWIPTILLLITGGGLPIPFCWDFTFFPFGIEVVWIPWSLGTINGVLFKPFLFQLKIGTNSPLIFLICLSYWILICSGIGRIFAPIQTRRIVDICICALISIIFFLNFFLPFQSVQMGFFGYFIIAGFYFRNLWNSLQGKTDRTGINRDPRRHARDAGYFWIGSIYLVISMIYRIGFISFYFMQHAYIQFYLWGAVSGGTQFIEIDQLALKNFFTLFIWGIHVSAGLSMFNIGRAEIPFRMLKKSFHLLFFLLSFELGVMAYVFIISIMDYQVSIPGIIPMVAILILVFSFVKYKFTFIKNESKK